MESLPWIRPSLDHGEKLPMTSYRQEPEFIRAVRNRVVIENKRLGAQGRRKIGVSQAIVQKTASLLGDPELLHLYEQELQLSDNQHGLLKLAKLKKILSRKLAK